VSVLDPNRCEARRDRTPRRRDHAEDAEDDERPESSGDRESSNAARDAHAASIGGRTGGLESTGYRCESLSAVTGIRGMLVPLAATAALVATNAPASAAEGGTRIANAPLLQWGEPEDGIGAHDIPGGGSSGTDFGHAFWRVRVFAGDRITGSGSEGTNGLCLDSMWLYAPSVTDANLQRSKATFETAVKHTGPSCDSRTYRWRWSNIPWTGVATLWANFGYQQTFTFVGRVSHRTRVRLRPVPRTVPTTATGVLLRASVTSAAGKPSGLCAFDRRGRGPWRQVRRVILRRGACSSRIVPKTSGSVQFRVHFVPDRGWLPSAATTPRIAIG
jgi:hypothetical protein